MSNPHHDAVDDRLVHDYFAAAGALLQHALSVGRRSEPAAYAEAARAVAAGGLVSIVTTFAPAAGLARVDVQIVPPNGEPVQLLGCELQRELNG